ncbi:DinB family protein [Geothrix sp. 21YS21S-4]|uniref:DinB family protein n=1 Tax=Geothrix sp. 21YS21S-4 TaxID=3068889 RepID=UPI0027BAAD63|nr:DinB family protein [Geothrix sp. 21YS21S-4]
MTPLAADLLLLFRRDLQCLLREVALFPDDASLWRTLPGIANSAGNVALHVAGNLQHFMGAVLGGTGYVREREREFAQREGRREDVAAELRGALAAVETGLAAVTEAGLAAPFPALLGGHRVPTGRFLLHLETHLAFHLGQVGYLRRALTGDSTGSGAVGIGEIAEVAE